MPFIQRLACFSLLFVSLGVCVGVQAGGRDYRHVDYGYTNPHLQPLSLSFKVRLNGDNSVRLRRLIEERYGVDTRNYRLHSVAVANKARYGACAELVTGRRSTGPVDLRRGLTNIASHGAGRGQWRMHFDDARVRRIRVELEPL